MKKRSAITTTMLKLCKVPLVSASRSELLMIHFLYC
jgi:hypothetical protein